MINKNSISFTITITFIVSLILITISFIILYDKSVKREEFFIKKRALGVARIAARECDTGGISDNLKNNINELNYTIIDNANERFNLLKSKNLKIKKVIKKRHTYITFMELNNKSLVDIKTPSNEFLLINNYEKTHTQQYVIATMFLIIMFSFVLLYLTTINKLKPINILKNKMKTLGDENFDIDCATDKKDEISQLSNEFDKTVKKLKAIKESRNIFIRNIMHELKTPITKGKFIIELPTSVQNSEKMKKVFYRLEALINEFAMIEKLISTKNGLNKKDYFLEDIIDNAIDILMCDEDEINTDINNMSQNIKLNIDFNLFSIAIKNLIDNGIKYSSNKKVTIKTTQNEDIVFENKGEKLQYDLENYFEPFFKGDDVKSNQSFGLGLYIIKHILDAHHLDINYIYEDGVNKFILTRQV